MAYNMPTANVYMLINAMFTQAFHDQWGQQILKDGLNGVHTITCYEWKTCYS